MEFSTKKFMLAFNRWLNKNNGYGLELQFDQESDPDYTYIVIRSVYAIRVPKDIIGTVLSTTPARFVHVEPMMEKVLDGAVLFHYKGLTTIRGDKEVCLFETEEGTKKYIDSKFFKEFYNKPIMKEVPENVSFLGAVNPKHPLLMFEDEDCVAMFCPIVP